MHYIIYVGVYLILILIYSIIYTIIYKKEGSFSLLSRVFLCAIIVILSGIRCNFGSDYYTYYRLYNVVGDQINTYGSVQRFLEQNVQVGYPYLMYLTRKISSSEYAIYLACAIIIYPLMFHWIDKHTKNKAYSIALFFLLGMFDITNNILKQTLALCALLYAFDAMIEKKYVKFVILSLVSIFFHISSIAVIMLIIVSCLVNLKKRHIFLLAGISLAITLAYTFILSIVISYISVLERYIEYSEGRVLSTPFVVTSIVYTLLYVFFSVKLIDNKKINENEKKRVNLLLLSIIFAVVSLRYIVLLRITYLALLQLIILIPSIDKGPFNGSKISIRITSISVVLLLFFSITSLIAGNNRYYNYSTIYNDQPKMEWYR